MATSIFVPRRVGAKGATLALPRRRRRHTTTREGTTSRVAEIFPIRREGRWDRIGSRRTQEDGIVEADIANVRIIERHVDNRVLQDGIGIVPRRVFVDAIVVPVGINARRDHEVASDGGILAERMRGGEG